MNMNKKILCKIRYAWICFALLHAGVLCAQNSFVGGALRYGHIIPNNEKARHAINDPAYGFSITLGKELHGDDYWYSFWNYPFTGIEFSYDYIRNPFTGNKLGLSFFVQPSFYKTPKYSIDWYIGLGLSYYSKWYDPITNSNNKYIGSPLNVLINLGFVGTYNIQENINVFGGIKFSHSSNGYLKKPNLGLNFINAEIGASYYFDNRTCTYPHLVKDSFFQKENDIYLSLSPGFVQSRHNESYYFAGTFTAGYSRRFHPCFAYGGGIDIMYNGTNATRPECYSSIENFSQAIFASFECFWGKVSLRVGFGVYTFNGEYQFLPYYERVGVLYHIGKNNTQFTGVSIKAHAGHADYIEWTYGIKLVSFPKKRQQKL